MTTAEFLSSLRDRDVRLWVEDGRLKCDAPPGVLTDALRAELAARKHDLLAMMAGARDALSASSALVPLKSSGGEPPLFARPGHNGDVFCYRALAEHLDPARPLYGVEPLGVDGRAVSESVEEIAAYEVEQIRSFKPRGPYYLAGYCAGGTIAFEVARQLAGAGQPVTRLILFGAPFPTTYRMAAQAGMQLRSIGERVKRHVSVLASGSISDGVDYLRDRTRNRSGEHAAEAARRDDPALAHRRRVEDATIAAVKRYEPRAYGGRVDLFLPNEAWRSSGDKPDEWKRVASRVVEHVGPDESNGDTMLREPHVRALARLLDSALREGA